MPTLEIEIDAAAESRLSKRARYAGLPPADFASRLLIDQLEIEEFPQGEIAAGCDRLRSVIMALPGTTDWRWSGVHHRHWWVQFKMDLKVEPAANIVRALAAFLNTDALQSWGYKPFVFTPEFGADSSPTLAWQIETLVSMVNPSEVAEYLEGRLPPEYHKVRSWLRFKPQL